MEAAKFKLDELIKQLQEMRSHIDHSQGMDLKDRLDASRKPVLEKASILGDDPLDPKGLAVEKVSVLDKPDSFDSKVADAIASTDDDDVNKGPPMPGQDEPTDEEVEEMERRLKQKMKVL